MNGDGKNHVYLIKKLPLASVAKVIEDLRRLKGKSQPFFLAVGFFKPHLPFIAPQRYWDLYDHEDIRLPDNYHDPKAAPKVSIHSSGELRA